MIERFVDFSIRNRALVIFAVLLVGALGLRSAQQLPIDAVPDVTNIQVQVLTTAPALGPLEVEKFITFPVETEATFSAGEAAVTSDVTVVYCPVEAESLCFIEQIRFRVPITVGDANVSPRITLPYRIELPNL